MSKAARVVILTAPDSPCAGTRGWAATVAYLAGRLSIRGGPGLEIEHVELFNPRSFELPGLLAAVEAGARLPIVTVNDRVVSTGEKLSEARLRGAVEAARALAPAEVSE